LSATNNLRKVSAGVGSGSNAKIPADWGAFRAAEAFISPSHQENFGMVIAEAMACRKPVLTTNKVNIWREVRETGAGLIANDDLDGITSLLDQFLLLSQEERKAMGQRAHQCFLEKFDISLMGQKLTKR
jgi:glycosyltransferase involved in cell wall biosynthesis